MEEFKVWFFVGYEHIVNKDALDHILFVLALSCLYDLRMLKKLIILITAFTIGHSFTLIISVLDLVSYNQKIIEFAIPSTIAITCLTNISKRNSSTNSKILNRNYWIALIFGLIHGLGFSNYLKALLGGGSILLPLFGFNVGLEIGQILIIMIFVFVSHWVSGLVFPKKSDWILFVSSVILGISLLLMSEAKFW